MSVTAPEAPTVGDPDTEVAKNPHAERRQREVTRLGRTILRSKLHESGALKKEPDARNSHENKLVLLEFLQTGKHPDNGGTFPNGQDVPFDGGNPLLMGEMDIKIGDTEVHFDNQQVALAGIAGVTEEGNYIGYFVDTKTGNQVSVDPGDGSESRVEVPLLPEMVVDAQMLAEADDYRQDLTPAQAKAFDAFLASRPQNSKKDDAGNQIPYELPDDIDATLTEAAHDSHVLTIADVKSFCNARLENTDPAAEAQFLKLFEGKVLLEPADMLTAMEAQGFGAQDLKDKAAEITRDIADLQGRMEGASDDVRDALQNEIDARKVEAQLYTQLGEAMATEAGREQIEAQMAAAFANPDNAAPLLDAFRKGDLDGMLDSLGSIFPEGMSHEAKEKVKSELLKKIGEKGLVGLGILGIIALIVGGIAVATAQMAANTGRQ